MPRSKKPRQAYKGPRSEKYLQRLDAFGDGARPARGPEPQRTFSPSHAKHRLPASPSGGGVSRGKLVVAGTLATTATAAALAHRRKNVSKLYDPFTDSIVEFGKSLHQVPKPQLRGDGGFIHLTSQGSLRPTGRFSGKGQDVKVIRRKKRTTAPSHDLFHRGHRSR